MIGDKVRKYRRQKELSQERLGELVGFSQSKISKIERSEWDSLSDLKLLAAALEVKIEELVKDETEDSGEKKNKSTDKIGMNAYFLELANRNVTDID